MAQLNLLPPHLKKKRQQKINAKLYSVTGVILLSIIFLLIYVPISQLIKVQAEESDYKRQMEQSNGNDIYMENVKIKKEIDNYKQYIEKVEQLTHNRVLISDRIHELEQYVPMDVIFDSLSYGENGLTINATAKSLESISRFTANIQTSGTYKNVRVSNIRMEDKPEADKDDNSGKEYKFTINAVQ